MGVQRTFVSLPSPTMPRAGHGSYPCQGLWWTPEGGSPTTALIASHYNIDFAEHYLAEPLAERGYGFLGLPRYGETKLMNILFTRELARRLGPSGITALSVHPGVVRTGLQRYLSDTRSPASWPAPTGRASFAAPRPAPPASCGRQRRTCPETARPSPTPQWPNDLLAPHAADVHAAKATWTMTEQLTGEHFPG